MTNETGIGPSVARTIAAALGRSTRLAAIGTVAIGMSAGFAAAQDGNEASVEEFYSGNTIDMIIGYSPGGGYDSYARLVARFLGAHIPGNPEIIPQNMPGASSRVAAEYVYTVAPQDGTVLATADQSLAVARAMGDESLNLDPSQFSYIGSPTKDNNVLITWHESGVETVDDAIGTEVPIGATGGSTSSQYPTIMNELLGTQFNIISGYPGGSDINFAMESGEVSGRGSANWASLRPLGWYEDGLINVLVQIGLDREDELPDTPLLYELAESEEDEELLRLLSAPVAVGRPVFTTPGVPEERVQALRDAFDAMIQDPEFLAAAEAEGLSISPTSGADLQQIVEDILGTTPEVAERLGQFILSE